MISDSNIENFFIDVTYKIVPKDENNYKLLTISGYNKSTFSTYICELTLIKYEDYVSFQKIFKYLNEMYDFNPSIIHIDYSNALRKSLLSNGLFKTKPIIIHCFFQFIQSIVKKMKFYKIIKKNYKI